VVAPSRDRLLTRSFALVTASGLAYFIGLGSLIPVLPLYVEGDLEGGATAVGVAVGSFAVTAAILRPLVGKVGDRRGRRPLIMGGALIVAASVLTYGLFDSLAWLVAMRLLSGIGEAAVFVGAATAAQDLAPPERRGEAASYFSIAIYGGLAVGPVLGEAVRHTWGVDEVWLVSAFFCVLAATLALGVPAHLGQAGTDDEDGTVGGRTAVTAGWHRYLHPAALRPGAVLAMATTGFAGFTAFVPLYVDQVGLETSGVVFAVYSVLVLAVRIFGGRLPDRLGPILTASIGLSLQAAGFVVLTLWHAKAGLYAGTVVYALGVSLLFPSLLRLVVDTAPDRERSHAVATFSLFFDVSQGLGAAALGVLVALSGERSAFAASALLAVIGVVILRTSVAAHAERRTAAFAD
jgi:MFS family permease